MRLFSLSANNKIGLKIILIFILLIMAEAVNSQTTFIVEEIPDYTPQEDILYIAGNFTGWQPGDPGFALGQNDNELWSITLQESAGTSIEFKFTRGSWETVEKGAFGEEIANRTYTFPTGIDTVYFKVLNWADEGGGGGSTASDNVHIVDENFYMPQLERTRRVWIYLPPDYESSGEEYPVLYMHDGQNLFDTQTSFAGEWEIDETLNKLSEEGMKVPIVVGIDNGGAHRIDEYSPWINTQYGGGQGDKYVEFLVNSLKPYIDENYRTLTDRDNTAIMGSSLGGFISHYASLKYPEIFSKAGIFSPSYWISDSVWDFTMSAGKNYPGKYYLLIGGEEGEQIVSQMWAMHDTLFALGYTDDEVAGKETPGGQHNETFWRTEFPEAYIWMFYDFANTIGNENVKRVTISPNPVSDYIDLKDITDDFDTLKIINSLGQVVYFTNDYSDGKIQIKKLHPGTHILVIKKDKFTIIAKFIKD